MLFPSSLHRLAARLPLICIYYDPHLWIGFQSAPFCRWLPSIRIHTARPAYGLTGQTLCQLYRNSSLGQLFSASFPVTL